MHFTAEAQRRRVTQRMQDAGVPANCEPTNPRTIIPTTVTATLYHEPNPQPDRV
jgi:hypothetical protein